LVWLNTPKKPTYAFRVFNALISQWPIVIRSVTKMHSLGMAQNE
jgi:hypothetical protein